jgi:tetratricopeptide (TPR) repeat protein
VATIFLIARRFSGIWGGAARWALVGVLVTLAGCEKFIADSRNTDGLEYYRQARYQEAIQQFNEATYADPNDPDGYYNLATIYCELGKKDRNPAYFKLAEENYHKCLDQNGNYTDCYRGLAVMLAQQGRKEEAFKLVQGWADRQPTLADPKVELARLYEEFGDRRTAENYLVEAIEAQPDNPRALTALGKMREDAGDKAQALANYKRSLESNSDQPQLALHVSALQTGAGPNVMGGSPAPEVELGTLMADRDPNTKTR